MNTQNIHVQYVTALVDLFASITAVLEPTNHFAFKDRFDFPARAAVTAYQEDNSVRPVFKYFWRSLWVWVKDSGASGGQITIFMDPGVPDEDQDVKLHRSHFKFRRDFLGLKEYFSACVEHFLYLRI